MPGTSRTPRAARAAAGAAAAALLLLAAAAGCDGGSRSATQPLGSTPGTPRAPDPAEDLTVPPPGGATSVTGTVAAGVEPGCLLLAPEGGGEAYLLLGGPAVAPGARVRVDGAPQPDLLTTCQQGVPLRVRALDVLAP